MQWEVLFELDVKDLEEIYKRRWAIESLYKQLNGRKRRGNRIVGEKPQAIGRARRGIHDVGLATDLCGRPAGFELHVIQAAEIDMAVAVRVLLEVVLLLL